MAKKKSRLRLAQEKVESTIKRTNERIDKLGECAGELYESLNEIQILFDEIRGVPEEEVINYEEIKRVRLSWKESVGIIENEYKYATAKTAGKGVAGAGAGVAVAALGPSAAMGVATTFGVASTGTAISSLSGAAATNAALAWLGGGVLASGGGGMAAGSAFLALAGPLGIAIAGVALLGSGVVFVKTTREKKTLESIYIAINSRDIKSYELATVEINERIERVKTETQIINNAIRRIEELGVDYNKMSEAEQYELISYVNLMNASTQLLVNPILGLLPKYTEDDFKEFLIRSDKKQFTKVYVNRKDQIVALANLLYKIRLNDKEKHLIHKSLRDNQAMRKALKLPKKEFKYDIIDMTFEVLRYQSNPEATDDDYICPICGAILNRQEGFSSELKTWKCIECGTQLFDEIVEGDVFGDVVWYCDSCGAVLNTQKGFTEMNGVWKCTECGYENSITEEDINE